MMNALIIEDEITAVKHLGQVLSSIGGISVIDTLDSISETIEWFSRNRQPDVIFMDIHLSDGIAFEIFRHISIKAPVIFTTAYDEYALKAFRVNSIDYLLKPIQKTDVMAALEKLRNLTDAGSRSKDLEKLIEALSKSRHYKTHFLIPVKGDKLIPVLAEDIACFNIDAGSIMAHTFDGRKYRFDKTLDDLEEVLDPVEFFRANRQYLISRSAIRDIDIWFNNRLSVNLVMSMPEKIIISRARITEFKNWFDKNSQRNIK